MENTWMIDGKPGLILGALVAAVKAVKPLEKRSTREMAYLNIDDVKLAVKAALNDNGIVTQWETLGNPLIDTGKAPFCVVEVRCTFIASDGSYVVSTIKGGGQAGMGRSLTVATTAAVKQILGLTLQLATGDEEERASAAPDDEDEWSENLRIVVGALNAAQDNDEIKRVGAMPEAKALGRGELPIAQHYGRERRKELLLLAQSAADGAAFRVEDYKTKTKVRP